MNVDDDMYEDVDNILEWNCEHCTFANHPSTKICQVCYKTPSDLKKKPSDLKKKPREQLTEKEKAKLFDEEKQELCRKGFITKEEIYTIQNRESLNELVEARKRSCPDCATLYSEDEEICPSCGTATKQIPGAKFSPNQHTSNTAATKLPRSNFPSGISNSQQNRPLKDIATRNDLVGRPLPDPRGGQGQPAHDDKMNVDDDMYEDVDNILEWNCEHCTFANHPSTKICQVCYKTPSDLKKKPSDLKKKPREQLTEKEKAKLFDEEKQELCRKGFITKEEIYTIQNRESLNELVEARKRKDFDKDRQVEVTYLIVFSYIDRITLLTIFILYQNVNALLYSGVYGIKVLL